MTKAEIILKRYDRMKAEHQLWEPVWQEIAEYIAPRRAEFSVQISPGAGITERLFDSTALDAHDRLASTLNGTLTSRAVKWFGLKMRDEALNQNADVQEWLENDSRRMFRAFNESNFAQEIHEVYSDECGFGTAGLFMEERHPEQPEFSGFIFRCLPLQSFCVEENAEGRVDTVYRTFQLTARVAVNKWGIEKMGEKITRAITDKKYDDVFDFVHVIEPRDNPAGNPKAATLKRKLPWSSIYVAVVDKKIMDEGGFHEFPIMVPRWSKRANEKYGRGPGHVALADVKTLNKIKEITLRMMGKALDPPTKSRDDGVVGAIRNQPGGNTVVRDMDFIDTLFPAGMFRESLGSEQIKSAELQAAVKRYFYADLTELPDKSYMTAFEVQKQYELLQRKLGPEMGRQETELLGPLIDCSFEMMFRRNGFLPPPAVLLEATDGKIDVVYESPLAKSQRLSEVEAIEQIAGQIVQIAQIHPEVIDVMDWDQAIRVCGEVRGIPAKVLRSQDAVDEIRSDRAAQQQQAQAGADMATAAKAMGQAAPALQMMQPGGENGATA